MWSWSAQTVSAPLWEFKPGEGDLTLALYHSFMSLLHSSSSTEPTSQWWTWLREPMARLFWTWLTSCCRNDWLLGHTLCGRDRAVAVWNGWKPAQWTARMWSVCVCVCVQYKPTGWCHYVIQCVFVFIPPFNHTCLMSHKVCLLIKPAGLVSECVSLWVEQGLKDTKNGHSFSLSVCVSSVATLMLWDWLSCIIIS